MESKRVTGANDYLKKHKILDLFENMTSQLIYNEPENPKEFLADMIDKLRVARDTRFDYPCLFDETNIASVFGMMDPSGKGFITLEQYKQALTTLGCSEFEQDPLGADLDRIDLDTFTREAKYGLEMASATFK